MLEFLTLGELLVALLMGLAALCAFIWGTASGALRNVEAAKHQVLRAEGIPEGKGEPSQGSPSIKSNNANTD